MNRIKNITNITKKAQAGKTVATKAVAAKRSTSPKTSKTKPAQSTTTPQREITSETIAARAYVLWEQAGRPSGRDVEYWLQAESQLKQDTQSFAA